MLYYIYAKDKPASAVAQAELTALIPPASVTTDIDKADVIITIGGDGALLSHALFGKPTVGINTGRIGFLTAFSHTEIRECVPKLLRGELHTSERAVISASYGKKNYYALNDIVFRRTGKLPLFTVTINGNVAMTFRGDGVAVATATGATAYSLSAGGVLVEPELDCLCVTPICPHVLTCRPLIVGGGSIVGVSFEKYENISAVFEADGDVVGVVAPDEWVTVTRANFTAKIIQTDKNRFFNTVRNKLC